MSRFSDCVKQPGKSHSYSAALREELEELSVLFKCSHPRCSLNATVCSPSLLLNATPVGGGDGGW